jgi:hypothetical protein
VSAGTAQHQTAEQKKAPRSTVRSKAASQIVRWSFGFSINERQRHDEDKAKLTAHITYHYYTLTPYFITITRTTEPEEKSLYISTSTKTLGADGFY